MEEHLCAYLSVGSNIQPEKNILEAARLLSAKTPILRSSSFYWTEPIGNLRQALYLNGIWEINTNFTPYELISEVLSDVENKLLRVRSEDKFAARTIDLDLLLYGNFQVEDERLTLPNPDLYERHFIAKCLTELEPDLILPDQTPIKDLIEKLPAGILIKHQLLNQRLTAIIQNHLFNRKH